MRGREKEKEKKNCMNSLVNKGRQPGDDELIRDDGGAAAAPGGCESYFFVHNYM